MATGHSSGLDWERGSSKLRMQCCQSPSSRSTALQASLQHNASITSAALHPRQQLPSRVSIGSRSALSQPWWRQLALALPQGTVLPLRRASRFTCGHGFCKSGLRIANHQGMDPSGSQNEGPSLSLPLLRRFHSLPGLVLFPLHASAINRHFGEPRSEAARWWTQPCRARV